MRRKLCVLPLLFLLLSCIEAAAQTTFSRKVIECHKRPGIEDRRLCRTITSPEYYESVLAGEKFELTTVQLDLNGDGRKELVVWESSWAGSSGGGLSVFSKTGTKLKRLIEADMTWSPILLLKTKHHGWFDIAYFQTGGGLDERFIVFQHNGKRYTVSKSLIKQPKGAVLIGRDWNRSVFGPLK